MRSLRPHDVLPLAICVAIATGCGGKGKGAAAAGGSGPIPSGAASAARPPSSGTPTSGSAPAFDASFPGVGRWETAETLKPCAVKMRDLEQNLSYGGIAMAASGNSFAFTWHLSTSNKAEALVAFSGYDSLTRTLGPSHGLGKGILYAPRVFPSGEGWLVVWFDPKSLVFTRSTWAPTLAELTRVGAVLTEGRDDAAVAAVADGSLAAASSFEVSGKRQLGVFTFAPQKDAPEPVHAVGAVKGADNPRLPALAALPDRFVVAWVDQGGRVLLGQLGFNGKELGPPLGLSHPGVGEGRPTVATAGGIVYAAWTEKDAKGVAVFVRAFDPKEPIIPAGFRVETGYAPLLLATEEGAVLTFLRKGENGPDVLGVAVDRGGKPATSGAVLVASTHKRPVADVPHAAALAADGRLGIGWTDSVERRAHFKTVVASCLGLAEKSGAAGAGGAAAAPSGSAPVETGP